MSQEQLRTWARAFGRRTRYAEEDAVTAFDMIFNQGLGVRDAVSAVGCVPATIRLRLSMVPLSVRVEFGLVP
jgi:hypothetical protein